MDHCVRGAWEILRRRRVNQNPCVSASRFLGAMQHLIGLSERDGLEHGFLICREGWRLVKGENRVGSEREIDLGRCEKGEAFGSFHTHPQPGEEGLSLKDVEAEWIRGVNFTCVGTPREIRCWEIEKHETGVSFKPKCRWPAKPINQMPPALC